MAIVTTKGITAFFTANIDSSQMINFCTITNVDVDFYTSKKKKTDVMENPYIEFYNMVYGINEPILLDVENVGNLIHVTGHWAGNVLEGFSASNPYLFLHWDTADEEKIMIYLPASYNFRGFDVDSNTTEFNKLKLGESAELVIKSTRPFLSAGGRGYEATLYAMDKDGKRVIDLSDNLIKSTDNTLTYEIPFECIEKGAVYGSFSMDVNYEGFLASPEIVLCDWYFEPAEGYNDIGSPTFEITHRSKSVPEEWDAFVQGKSYAHAEADAKIKYGELTFDVKVGEKEKQGKSLDFENETQAGTVQCTLTVTDTWGRTVERKTEFTVLPYAVPVIESIKAVRCDESGSETETGTSYKASAVTVYSDCGGHNIPTLTLYSKLSSETEYALVGPVPLDGELIVPDGAPDVEKSYDVCFVLTDTFNTVRYYAAVMTGNYFMYFKRGGKGVAVGKAAEFDNLFDIGYGLRVRGDTTMDGELIIHRPDGSTVTMTQILEALGL